MSVEVTTLDDGQIWVVAINRPSVRNCVDGPTANQLSKIFISFDKDERSRVAVLYGKAGCFCAGADLKAVGKVDGASQKMLHVGPVNSDGAATAPPNEDHNPSGVMGFSRLLLSKPVIAAVQGFAVAGGLELACWCDLRVAEEDAVFGVYCRRWGVPLIDGGTFRLVHLIGLSRAMDMILTGRAVSGSEAREFGLANRIVPVGTAVENSIALARMLAKFPQDCLRADRMSAYKAFYYSNMREALESELSRGGRTLEEAVEGARRFAVNKQGRHGSMQEFIPNSKL